MTTTILGKVRPTFRGPYDNAVQYEYYDMVDFEGSSYIAKGNTIGNLPINTTYWQLNAEKGEQGSLGATGFSPTATVSKVGNTATISITDKNGTTTAQVTDGTNGTGGTSTTVPSYLQSHVDVKAEVVRKLQNEDTVTFAFATDIHYDEDWQNASVPVDLINYLENQVDIKRYISGGDQINSWDQSKQNALDNHTNLMKRINKKEKFLPCIGNHDVNRDVDDTRMLTLSEVYGRIYKQIEEVAIFDSTNKTGGYYYCDLSLQKIRIIVLNTHDVPYDIYNGGNLKYAPNSTYAVRDAQIKFIKDKALNFSSKTDKAEWKVLFVCHAPLLEQVDLHDWITGVINRDVVLGIATAFKNGTSFTKSAVTGDFAVTGFTSDFTSQGAIDVIGFLFGHTHYDQIIVKDGFTHIGALPMHYYTDYGTVRTLGTINEIALDLVTLNLKTKQINLTRFGAGSDRVTSWGGTVIQNTAPTAPVIALSAVNNTTVTISLTTASTDTQDGTITSYEIYKDGVFYGNTTLAQGGTYQLAGLTSGNTYSITAKAKDSGGLLSSASNSVSATTTSTSGNNAPTSPVISLVGTTDTTATIRLDTISTDTEDGIITEYTVYKDGVSGYPITLAQNGTYQLTNLTPNTSYAITLKARDSSDVFSNASNIVTAITTNISNGNVLSLNGSNFPTTNGVWLDGSPLQNNVTPTNFSYTTSSGKDGSGGVKFDGTDDYVECGADTDFAPTSYISIEAKFKLSSLTGVQNIMTKASTSGYSLVYNLDSDNKLSFSIRNGGVYKTIKSNTALTVGTTYHVVARYTGTVIELFVNGVKQTETLSVTGAIEQNTSIVLRLGATQGAASNFFSGTLYKTKIWNRAVTDEEVAYLYAN